MRVKKKGAGKVNNIYLLEKDVQKRRAVRRALRTVVHIGFRCGVVVAAVLLLGVWAGMEFGPIMLGRRLLMSAMLIIMFGASWLGAELTHVELPFDGGEEDE